MTSNPDILEIISTAPAGMIRQRIHDCLREQFGNIIHSGVSMNPLNDLSIGVPWSVEHANGMRAAGRLHVILRFPWTSDNWKYEAARLISLTFSTGLPVSGYDLAELKRLGLCE